MDPVDRWQLKTWANLLNGSTLLGLGIAALGRARLRPGPRGLLLATGYRLPVPTAPAFTVGNVVVSRHDPAWWEPRPRMLLHEERHSWQYVVCLGLPMLPLYALAAGWSYLRGGDPGVHNVFERTAGLADGGYPTLSRWARRRQGRAQRRPQRTA
ncbi:MAG TPA: hypothetical protein VLA97_18965 [Nocardioidaceae bacterium]|nr:hypothetical protein [Nocardioidaceae bacterium]